MNARSLASRWIVALALVAVLAGGCGLADLPSGNPSGPTPGSSTTDGVTPSVSATPTASPTPAAPTPTPAPTAIAYVVQANDTLLSLGRRFGTSGRSIAYWNRATYPSLDPDSAAYDPNRIEIGWTLTIIPGVIDETPSPGPPSSPTPAPSTFIPPAPTPPADGSGLLVTHGARGGNAVALTFDMGGRTDPAGAIVQWLIDHDVRATVFPTGQLAATDATAKAVLKLVASRLDLFTLGDHSYDHPDFTTLSRAAMIDQVTRTEAAIESLIGLSTKPFFRPPYGAQGPAVRSAVASAGFVYTVMWDVDTIDWKATADGGPTADDIVAKVLSRAQGGSIVLMHLGGWNTLEALPRIVAGLGDRGFEPVTLADLFGR